MEGPRLKVAQAIDLDLKEDGSVVVAFARLGDPEVQVPEDIDKDGEVSLVGSIPVGKEVPISAYGHTSWPWAGGRLPVGKGVLSEEAIAGMKAGVLRGKFFLNTTEGRDTYVTVKELGDLQEWSFGFAAEQEPGVWAGQPAVLNKRYEIWEVSPVLVGAGNGTRTLEVKAIKTAIPSHKTATDDAAWDAGENVARLPNDRDALRAAHAWVDPEGDPDAKSSYKFPHHFVSADGSVGAASIVACSTGIGILNGGRGGADIPAGDRTGVYRHLAAHLRDAGREVPELRSAPDTGALADAVERFLVDAAGLEARFRAMAELRKKEGRVLSSANRQRLAEIEAALAQLDEVRRSIRELLDATDPNKGKQAEVLRAEAEYLAITARLAPLIGGIR
jgi:hypothetical protein